MTRLSMLAVATLACGCAYASASASASPAVPSAPMLARRVLGSDASLDGRSSRPLLTAAKRDRKFAVHRSRSMTLVRVVTANHSATREPDEEYYLGAAQIYPWAEGSLYRLYAAPEQISDIELEQGETLTSVAAGDTARWVIGDTSSGTGATRRVHVLVKPAASHLRTNLVIATDRRIYHVEAVSTLRTAMATVSWTYPKDGMNLIRASAPTQEVTVVPAVAVENLDFSYRIEGADAAWRPIRAFDDGHQTFIEFPPTLAEGEAPPMFITGADGKAQLVNYRVKGHYYVVDRLFAAAELRLGGRHQQIVRIVRDDARRRSTRRA